MTFPLIKARKIELSPFIGYETGVLVKYNVGMNELNKGDLSFLGTDTYPETGKYKMVVNKFMIPGLLM